VAAFRVAFDADPTDLRALNNLVREADKADRWEDLVRYARIMFERTQAVDGCFLVAMGGGPDTPTAVARADWILDIANVRPTLPG
jgi:hypothetical protein